MSEFAKNRRKQLLLCAAYMRLAVGLIAVYVICILSMGNFQMAEAASLQRVLSAIFAYAPLRVAVTSHKPAVFSIRRHNALLLIQVNHVQCSGANGKYYTKASHAKDHQNNKEAGSQQISAYPLKDFQ